jgi:formamidopyrimidine-DNA glycosylase
MPELPEVRQFLAEWREAVEGLEIAEIVSLDARVMPEASETLTARFKGKSFTRFTRVGKQMFTGTDSGEWLRFHFGMTGDFSFFKVGEGPPAYSRGCFFFKDGSAIAFLDPRKFGKVEWVPSPEAFCALHEWGPDALEMGESDFVDRLSKKKGKAKMVLMDQHVLAGIGNIYADEMLFQAGIHPEANLVNLGPKRLKRLYAAMHRSMAQSITYDTPASEIPAGFFITQRKKGGICTQCQSEIQEMRMGGRGTYYCPKCQAI